jgi:hypothetical protein
MSPLRERYPKTLVSIGAKPSKSADIYQSINYHAPMADIKSRGRRRSGTRRHYYLKLRISIKSPHYKFSKFAFAESVTNHQKAQREKCHYCNNVLSSNMSLQIMQSLFFVGRQRFASSFSLAAHAYSLALNMRHIVLHNA